MAYTDMQSFMRVLERRGLLKRVSAPVNPELEVTEIATRLVRDGGPAVLFENVEGASDFLWWSTCLGRWNGSRSDWAATPRRLAKGCSAFLEDVNPPSLGSVWRNRGGVFNLLECPSGSFNPAVGAAGG